MELTPFQPALLAIGKALRQGEPLVVAVDGRCGAGKTTFASLCTQTFDDCNVFHLDDFFLPFEKRTAERLTQPGGNVDYERAERELFAPLSRGETVTYTPFDCGGGTRAPVTAAPKRLSVVEGSYSHHLAFAPYITLKLFLTCSPDTQRARLLARAPEKLADFETRWIPLEEQYFSALEITAKSDLILDTTPTKEDFL